MNYTPKPIDISNVKLDEELLNVVEKLSENTHEIWSLGRMNEGWSYGEKRNDDKKEHPCLVPYEMLSESEKEYDRNTTINVIKALIALGFNLK